MLREAFVEHSLGQTADFQWNSCFNVDRVKGEDDENSGWPSTSKTTENVKICELNHKDRHKTIYELADQAGICYGVRLEILTENLNMRRIAGNFVPCFCQVIRVCD